MDIVYWWIGFAAVWSAAFIVLILGIGFLLAVSADYAYRKLTNAEEFIRVYCRIIDEREAARKAAKGGR